MKLTQQHNDYHAVGDRKTIQFGIDASNIGLVYKSFLNYSNPIGSIVREITSNCFDSHAEVGIDDGITVKITDGNYLNGTPDTIHFIDYGVGLSPERVENTYCKFFTSTKRETNTQIGGFGVGAKSPLGYTDMFYVKTNYNGKQYTYIVHKGELAPEMDLIDTQDTTETNGTEVIINIKSGDKWRFKQEIKQQLKYFDNINFINCEVNDYSLVREGPFIYNTSDSSSDTDICIGKVRYPLDKSVINVPKQFNYFYQGLGIYFDIGELEVVWNREAINYSKHTIEVIENRLVEAVQYIKKKTLQKFDKTISVDEFFDDVKNSENNKTTYIQLVNKHIDVTNFVGSLIYKINIGGQVYNIDKAQFINGVLASLRYYSSTKNGTVKPVSFYVSPIKNKNDIYILKGSTVPAITYHLHKKHQVHLYKVDKASNLDIAYSELVDKYIATLPKYDDITVTDAMKEEYKAFLASTRKKKATLTSNESLYAYIYSGYGFYRSEYRYSNLFEHNYLYIIGTASDKENLIKIQRLIKDFSRNNSVKPSFRIMHFSKVNFDFIMQNSPNNVMFYGDFLKSKYITRLAQRIANRAVYDTINFKYSFRKLYPDNPFVKLSNKWDKKIKHAPTESELFKTLPEPDPELVVLKKFYEGLNIFIKNNAPYFNFFSEHHPLSTAEVKDRNDYLSRFKINNYTYYVSKNIDNKEQ